MKFLKEFFNHIRENSLDKWLDANTDKGKYPKYDASMGMGGEKSRSLPSRPSAQMTSPKKMSNGLISDIEGWLRLVDQITSRDEDDPAAFRNLTFGFEEIEDLINAEDAIVPNEVFDVFKEIDYSGISDVDLPLDYKSISDLVKKALKSIGR